MPTSTSLVTNLPADFNTFGQGVDTSMAQLKGGTTGQVLSKTSATDMAFTWVTPTDQTPLTTKGDLFTFSTVDARLGVGTNGYILSANSSTATGLEWIANDQGDITSVTAGTGISGGGTSGAVTITNSMATEITASGDIIVGTGSGTFDNLPIGTTGQVLTADTTVSPYKVKWAASGGSSGPTFRATRITSDYTIPSASTFTKMPFNGEDWDTGGCYDNATNYRFTPTTAGYYQINSNCNLIIDSLGRIIWSVYKNGSAYARIFDGQAIATSFNIVGGLQMYFNGTTDYAEMYIWTAAATTRIMPQTVSYLGNTFDGVWIRS